MKQNRTERDSWLFTASKKTKAKDKYQEISAFFQYSESSLEEKVSGRWTPQEHKLFCKLYPTMGSNWSLISAHICSRTEKQVRSHAQKYLGKLKRKQNERKELEETKKIIMVEENLRLTRNKTYCITETKQDQNKDANGSILEIKNKRSFPTQTEEDYPTILQFKDQNQSQMPDIEDADGMVEKQKIGEAREKSFIQIEVPEPNFGYAKQQQNGHSIFFQSLLPFLLQGLPTPVFIFNNENKNYTQSQIYQFYQQTHCKIETQQIPNHQHYPNYQVKVEQQYDNPYQQYPRYDTKLRSTSDSLSPTASQNPSKQKTAKNGQKMTENFESLI